VVRAGLQAGLLQDQQHRMWYSGPMFRHERPQKGRYRQFHQLGAEIFGIAGADIEAELILLAARFWKRLGLDTGNATNTGLALQALLDRADTEADESGAERMRASIILGRTDCVFVSEKQDASGARSVYHRPIASPPRTH